MHALSANELIILMSLACKQDKIPRACMTDGIADRLLPIGDRHVFPSALVQIAVAGTSVNRYASYWYALLGLLLS